MLQQVALSGLYFTQSTPGTGITDSFSPLEPDGQFPALCPDRCPSRVTTRGPHLQTRGAYPQIPKRKNDKQRGRALPGRRGHRMLMQPEERVGPRLPASASAGSQLSRAPLRRSHRSPRAAADPRRRGGGVVPATLSSAAGSLTAGDASSLPSQAFHCSDGGGGGGAAESPVGLSGTPPPPPQILVHPPGGRKRQMCRVRWTSGVLESPTGDTRCAPFKTHTRTHMLGLGH